MLNSPAFSECSAFALVEGGALCNENVLKWAPIYIPVSPARVFLASG